MKKIFLPLFLLANAVAFGQDGRFDLKLGGLPITPPAHTQAFASITGSISTAQLAAGTGSDGNVPKLVDGMLTWPAETAVGAAQVTRQVSACNNAQTTAGWIIQEQPAGVVDGMKALFTPFKTSMEGKMAVYTNVIRQQKT